MIDFLDANRPNTSMISHVLPKELISYFDIISITELCDLKTRAPCIEVEHEGKNVLLFEYEPGDYESKGFLSSKRVQDFPLR